MCYISSDSPIGARRFIIIGGERNYRNPDGLDSKAVGGKKWYNGFVPWLINQARDPVCPKEFRVIQYEEAKKGFRFPPNHPVADMAYAVCEIVPDFYVPISTFHDYLQQMKHASLVQLCANLGAKKMLVEDVHIDNKEADLNMGIPGAIANLGINIDKKARQKAAFSFSESNKSVKPFESPWIDTEPTWKAMIDMRKNNFLERFKCEYNYQEDFGVNAKLSASIKNFDIEIGGSFTKMKKINIKYDVIFWQ